MIARSSLLFVFAVGVSAACCTNGSAGVIAWINELHYDNTGTDSGEFIEVIAHNSVAPEDLIVEFYNGATGESYFVEDLGLFNAGDVDGDYTVFWLPVAGIQNGGPDGVALFDFDSMTLLEFISYEGEFTAEDGVAMGAMSSDIGVSQSSSTPVGSSIGLTGGPIGSFTWTNFDTTLSGDTGATPGSINHGQFLIPGPATMAVFGLAAMAGTRRRRRG